MKKTIILASKSKRRAEILSACRIRHKIVVTGADEHMCSKMPISDLVMLNAQRKALVAAQRLNKGIVLGVDTLVFLDKKPVGKPDNETAARKLLKALSGKTVVVYTGLCILDKDKKKRVKDFDKTELKVKKISEHDIEGYFKVLEPYDKAGGFSIEGPGAILFDNLKGSYFNVLGLPMGKLQEMLKKIGHNILEFMQ
ncbi:MAG: Maf family protein [Candidatus Omnitrophota bacterium]